MSKSDKDKEIIYWYLKMRNDFFEQFHIKLMGLQPNGESLQLLYLRLLLYATEGKGVIAGFGSNSVEETIAIAIGASVDRVKELFSYLEKQKYLLERLPDGKVFLPECEEMCKPISAGYFRVLKSRMLKENQELANDDTEMIHPCNASDTQVIHHCNTLETNNNKKNQSHSKETKIKELLSEHDKDFETIWDKIQQLYPNKRNFDDALTFILSILNENNYEEVIDTLYDIYKGITLYINDYKERNDDDEENLKFVPQLAKWLEKDSSYWMNRAKEIRVKIKEEQKKKDALHSGENAPHQE